MTKDKRIPNAQKPQASGIRGKPRSGLASSRRMRLPLPGERVGVRADLNTLRLKRDRLADSVFVNLECFR